MKYFLKKDLPGIKAGEEMKKHPDKELGRFWGCSEKGKWTLGNLWIEIPNSELSDWIEERVEMWKPKEGDAYFIPEFSMRWKYTRSIWANDGIDNYRLSRGLVCPTPELAIELHDRMIETAKKFWEEKE